MNIAEQTNFKQRFVFSIKYRNKCFILGILHISAYYFHTLKLPTNYKNSHSSYKHL